METNALIIGLGTFTCVLTAALVAHFGYFATVGTIEERLNDLTMRAHADDSRTDLMGSRLVQWALHRMPAPRTNTSQSEKIARMLACAGFNAPGAAHKFAALRFLLVLALASTALGFGILFRVGAFSTILYAIGGGIAGNVGPMFVLGRLGVARQRAIKRELGDILDLLVVCIESGLGLFQAIRTVGRESQRQGQKMGSELQILSASLNSGGSLGAGLRAMADRTGLDEIKSLAAILTQSEKLGSQLGPALRASADALRNRRRLAAEEAAQKATIKMLLPLVIFVLPAMMAVILGPAVVTLLRNFRGH